MKRLIVLLGVLCLVLTIPAFAQQFSNTGKKIVEYGWDVPTPEYLKANIASMEKWPFDGLVFRINSGSIGSSFDTKPWPEDKLKVLEADLKAIKWSKYKYNFLCLYAASDFGMNWFDDEQWKIVLSNARASARLAKAAKCVGIVFDPEPYGKDPWSHPGDYPNRPFEEVAKQARMRGKQWIQALQEKWPNMHLLLFYFFPDQNESPYYKLLGAFCNGLVEGSSNKAKIINGNEFSYYHTDPQSYINDWKSMRIDGPNKIDPKLKGKYNQIVQAGMALYMDQSLALREPQASYISYYMTPEERLKYFEHAVYWAMKTTDEYVWCYSERLTWWNASFPAGADKAIISARTKLESGKSLGYSLSELVNRAKDRRDKQVADRIVKRFAAIDKLAQGTSAPVIDGKLDDATWKSAKLLDKFVPAASAPAGKTVVDTVAYTTYDDKNLYLAVECSEPSMDKIVNTGSEKDSDVWNGDCLEIFISTTADTPYENRHFIINPNNAQWDGKSPPENNDVTWNADWQSAVTKNAASWTVEVAIPWSAIGGYPAAGSTRFANLCRQRKPVDEWSSWSTVFDGFLDASKFGAWMFR